MQIARAESNTGASSKPNLNHQRKHAHYGSGARGVSNANAGRFGIGGGGAVAAVAPVAYPPGLYSQAPAKRGSAERNEPAKGHSGVRVEEPPRQRKLNSSKSVEMMEGRDGAGKQQWRNLMDMERRRETDSGAKLDAFGGQYVVSDSRRRGKAKRTSMGAFVFK